MRIPCHVAADVFVVISKLAPPCLGRSRISAVTQAVSLIRMSGNEFMGFFASRKRKHFSSLLFSSVLFSSVSGKLGKWKVRKELMTDDFAD